MLRLDTNWGWVVSRALLGVGLLLAACEATPRNFGPATETRTLDPDEAELGGERASGDAAPPGAEGASLDTLGLPCTGGETCISGFCVDGVCCDRPCAEVCATCAAPGAEGTCGPASGDAACDSLSCGVTTECRGYEPADAQQNCEAFGVCRTTLDCVPTFEPAGTPCRESAGSCDGQGECLVAGTARLGAGCAVDSDCGSGHCITSSDGTSICCEAACDGPCQQCGAAGRCDEVPESDSNCERTECPPDNVCRDYSPPPAGSCRALGFCNAAQDCVSVGLRPASSCECDSAGECRLGRGARCAVDSECAENACEANASGAAICCSEHCGDGLFCAADGSGCVECDESSGDSCEGTSAVSCSGGTRVVLACPNGCTPGVGCNEQAPIGFSCAAAQCAGNAVCQTDANGARRCCVRNCAADGRVCAADGSCVCPEGQAMNTGGGCQLQRGDPCGSGMAQCAPGLTCVDGVCCNEACNGTCERCNLPGSVGQCSFDARETLGCAAGEECIARNDCRRGLGTSCSVGGDCVSNNCMAVRGVMGTRVCCAEACGGQRAFCSTDGDRCVECEGAADCANGCSNGLCNPLQPSGGVCTVNTQCAAGVCLNDSEASGLRRCCAGCSADQTCSSDGRCVTPPAQQGNSCTQGQTCGPGLSCVSGICCNALCEGVCESCTNSGVCQQEFGEGGCPAGQECSTRTTCAPLRVQEGESCADGEACPLSASCRSGICMGVCRLSGPGLSNGSRSNSCVLSP